MKCVGRQIEVNRAWPSRACNVHGHLEVGREQSPRRLVQAAFVTGRAMSACAINLLAEDCFYRQLDGVTGPQARAGRSAQKVLGGLFAIFSRRDCGLRMEHPCLLGTAI